MKAPEWPSAVERQQIERALHGKDVEKLTIRAGVDSPWLQVDAWVHMVGDYKLALWRASGAVYELDSLGAVKENPIIPRVRRLPAALGHGNGVGWKIEGL